jgi:hypothetical protein
MQFIGEEADFWNLTEAAESVFSYRREKADLIGAAWGFDRGGVAHNGKSAYAQFSCVALSGWGKTN